MIELIGTNAGLVWNVLNEGGKMSFKAVKKATKIKAEKDMYAAFGWLAKEPASASFVMEPLTRYKSPPSSGGIRSRFSNSRISLALIQPFWRATA